MKPKNKIREVIQDGVRTVGNGPGYLQFYQNGDVWIVSINRGPDPDNKAIYKGLDALTDDGHIKTEVYYLATLPIEEKEIFRDRTMKAWRELEQAIQSGNILDAQAALLTVGVSISFAIEANVVLQPIREILLANESKADGLLTKLVSCLKAAAKFRLHESRVGTSNRIINLTHAKFTQTVRLLAKQLQRAPYRAEIQAELGCSLAAIRKLCAASGFSWLPSKSRGADAIPGARKW
jgi:hypothetical protein